MYIKTILLGLLFFEFIQANFQSNEVNKTTTKNKDIFQLLNDGLTHIHPHPSKKAILLVGLTGSGKTTLAKFITGDNNRLMSVAVKNNSDPLNECSDMHSDYFSDSDTDTDCETTESIYEYYIKDIDDDKIGSDITISKTLYPETYVDQTNGAVIIDCPGFEDTRSQAHEIANAVFMKNIFDWATQVKIILVVNHGDVRRGSSRNEFPNLLRFLSIFLKDVTNFHTSIGMTVTKVTNEYVNDKVATDKQMITQIGEYLSSIRSELIERDSENSNIVLVNSLLKQIGPNYPNIAIFRKPYKPGSLESIPEIQAGKKKIIKMLYSNLMYANVTASSIGFSFSRGSESVIITMCSKLKKKIDVQLKKLNENFRQYYQNQIDQARNYDELRDLLQKEKKCFDSSKLDKTIDFESQLKIFFDVLTTNKLHTYLNLDAMNSNLINQLTHLKLLQTLSNDDLTKSDLRWSAIVPELVQHLVSLSDWYDFIVTAFERMSQNDVQANKSNLGLGLTNWVTFKTYTVTELNLKVYPNVMRKLTLEVYEQKSLIDILKVISEPPIVRQIQSDTNNCEIFIEGYFVRTSDIEKFMKSCDNKPLSAIYVFAQYTVFFDSSIDKDGSELLLSIIAPKWEIIGQQTISLNGINATNPAYTVKRDGNAGNPGGQAGTFFGVGYDFVNGENLSVFTNGGTGGNGQNGENGRSGHDDIDVWAIKKFFCTPDKLIYLAPRYFTHNKINYVGNYKNKVIVAVVYSKVDVTIEIRITSGPEATPGFNGGRQGLGGFNGLTSDIIRLSGLQTVSLFNNQGADGEPGKGGTGGRGAIVNGKAFFKGKHQWVLFAPIFECKFHHRINGEAKPAINGLNNQSGKLVKPNMTIHMTHPIVSKYRRFLIKKTTDPSTLNPKSSYKVFLNFLNNNEKIIEITDLNDLVYEFIALEELNQKRPGIQELTSMYDMLLKMIENCADKERKNKPETFMVTANYLYAAILSRKLNIESKFSENFIIDVSGFVNHVKNQLEEISELNQEIKIKAVQKLYNEDIAKKEKDGDDFVTEQFGVEMTQINLKIDTAISGLLQEIKDISNKLETSREQAIKDIEKMKKLFIARSIFTVLKTVGQVVSFFGPEAKVVGSVLNAGASIGTEIVKNQTPNPKALLENTNSLKLFDNNFMQNYNKKTNSMISHIGSIVSKNPEIQKTIVEIKDTVIALAKNSTSLTKIYEKCTQMIAKCSSSSNTTQKKDDDDGSLDYLGTSLKFAYSGAVEIYGDFTKYAAGKNEAEQVKAELDARISKLHAYENSVQDSFRTNLENLMSLMDSITTRSKGVSTVALETSRYNIRNTLKDMSVTIKAFTSDFEANEDLVSCIESLENLMMTTMNIYDHLQTYNDQRNLGSLITNINSVKSNRVQTGDAQLDNAIQQLDYMLVSNTIQNQYLRAVYAFQQLVFPFAPIFLNQIQMPVFAPAKNGTENIQLVISKIKNLQNIIKDQQSSVIHGYDEQVFTNRFDETNPFFVWDATTHAHALNNLLKWNEITLQADILESVVNAVKFNDIRLKLVSTDNDQLKLDNSLANFRMKMTHMGNSRYRCDNKFFIIANQPQIIEYSFATTRKGVPINHNNAYKKIRDGDILLSPYALWKFQLVNKQKDLPDLSQFYGKIKLVLLGAGQYVRERSSICRTDLEKYYQFDKLNTAADKCDF